MSDEPNMGLWMNPQIPPGMQPQQQPMEQQPQPQQMPQAQPPVQEQPAQQQTFQPPAGPQQMQDPNTGVWYGFSVYTGQWEPIPNQPQQPQFAPPVPVMQQPPAFQPTMQQPVPGMQMPQQVPQQQMPQQQPGMMSPAQQLEQMRNQQGQRAANAPSLKGSLAGVQAGNFNLVDTSLMYEGKVTKATLKETKDKSHWMIELKVTISYPSQYAGTMLTNNLNLTEESMGFYRAALEAAGLFDEATEMPLLPDNEPEQAFVGKYLRFSVAHQEWPKGQNPPSYRNAINGAFSKAFESPQLQGDTQPQQQTFQPPAQQPQPFIPPAMQPQQVQVPIQPPVQQVPQQVPQQAQPQPVPQAFQPPTGYVPPTQQPQPAQPATQPNFGIPQQ